jgi:hypothetical protein
LDPIPDDWDVALGGELGGFPPKASIPKMTARTMKNIGKIVWINRLDPFMTHPHKKERFNNAVALFVRCKIICLVALACPLALMLLFARNTQRKFINSF